MIDCLIEYLRSSDRTNTHTLGMVPERLHWSSPKVEEKEPIFG